MLLFFSKCFQGELTQKYRHHLLPPSSLRSPPRGEQQVLLGKMPSHPRPQSAPMAPARPRVAGSVPAFEQKEELWGEVRTPPGLSYPPALVPIPVAFICPHSREMSSVVEAQAGGCPLKWLSPSLKVIRHQRNKKLTRVEVSKHLLSVKARSSPKSEK